MLAPAACAAPPPPSGQSVEAPFGPIYAAVGTPYGPILDGAYEIEALDLSQRSIELDRQQVAFNKGHPPGTIVINIAERRLYLTQQNGTALRYAVGVGRSEAINFKGNAIIGRKAEWPHWRPTENMIQAKPEYAAYRNGMPGGLENPLGARALYLYRDGQDTNFRLHGTTEPETIGTPVSSGCIRLVNQDIIDLYQRVPLGTQVIVMQS
ncbi:MAG: L,D-transpeptidase [Alphaproteobacteria bacterium]|nr:L,D-transpeptidase [Alphaproteobacteria bacterium]